MTSASEEKLRPFNFFQSREHLIVRHGPDPENRVGDHDTGIPGRLVSSGLQVPGEPGHCSARTSTPLGDLTAEFFLQNVLPLQQHRRLKIRVDSLALWKIINEEDAVLIPKIEARTFPTDFCTRN